MKKLNLYAQFLFLISLLGMLVFASCDSKDDSGTQVGPNSTSPGQTGTVGSTARFAIANDHIYVLNSNNLSAYSITNEGNISFVTANNLGNGISAETLFPYGGYLFMGTTTGMNIYNMDEPARPRFVSTYRHITACDPVVVSGNYAYVTLRDGMACQNTVNRLDVVDISNITSPQQVGQLNMLNPHGLAIRGTQLVVCEGANGIKSLTVDNPTLPGVRQFLQDGHAVDVIAGPSSWVVTGDAGISQYELDGLGQLRRIGFLPAGK